MVSNKTQWHVWITNEDLETFKSIFSSEKKPSEEEALEVFNNEPSRFRKLNYG